MLLRTSTTKRDNRHFSRIVPPTARLDIAHKNFQVLVAGLDIAHKNFHAPAARLDIAHKNFHTLTAKLI